MNSVEQFMKQFNLIFSSLQVVPGKLFTGSYDGSIRVWNTTGVKDETVFGTDYNEKDSRDEEIEEDSEDVQKAVKSLDPYLTY